MVCTVQCIAHGSCLSTQYPVLNSYSIQSLVTCTKCPVLNAYSMYTQSLVSCTKCPAITVTEPSNSSVPSASIQYFTYTCIVAVPIITAGTSHISVSCVLVHGSNAAATGWCMGIDSTWLKIKRAEFHYFLSMLYMYTQYSPQSKIQARTRAYQITTIRSKKYTTIFWKIISRDHWVAKCSPSHSLSIAFEPSVIFFSLLPVERSKILSVSLYASPPPFLLT